LADLKKKLKNIKKKEEMVYIDELAEGPIMTKRYWKKLQEAREKEEAKERAKHK